MPAWTSTRCWRFAGLSSTRKAGSADGLHAPAGRDRACDRHQPARARGLPLADELRRRLQPRQGRQTLRPLRGRGDGRRSARTADADDRRRLFAIDKETQMDFTLRLGEIEHAIGTSLRAPEDYRWPTSFADVSNLDKDDKPFARDDRRRLFAIGNRLWHSDSSFKPTPAKYSILHGIAVPSTGGNTRVRRHAGGLGRAGRGDQGGMRGAGLRAFADLFQKPAGLRRFLGGRARAFRGRPPDPGPHPPRDGADVALSLQPRRRDRRLAGAGGPRLPARSDRTRDTNASSCTLTSGRWATW